MWYRAGICSLTASLLVKLLQVCLNSTAGQLSSMSCSLSRLMWLVLFVTDLPGYVSVSTSPETFLW